MFNLTGSAMLHLDFKYSTESTGLKPSLFKEDLQYV